MAGGAGTCALEISTKKNSTRLKWNADQQKGRQGTVHSVDDKTWFSRERTHHYMKNGPAQIIASS